MAATRGSPSPRSTRRLLLVVAAVLLPLLVVVRIAWYFHDRSVLVGELLASMQADWAALKAEEDALPPGTNAAEVWKEIAGLLPSPLRIEARPSDDEKVRRMLDSTASALARVDAALERRACRFPVNGPLSVLGPFVVVPYGPAEQATCTSTIPALLERRGRLALGRGRPREALEDARRILLAVRQGMDRCYHGPFLVSDEIESANDLVRDALRSPGLAAEDARFAAALPAGSGIFTGREGQGRLHRLHADIDLYGILTGFHRGKQARDLREELGLPAAIPVLGFSIHDPGAIRAIRAAPSRPLRAGLGKWPESGPVGCLLRLDLLRTAAALRAFQIENGRPAPDLRGIETGYLGQSGPVYEVTRDGWSLRTASNRAHYSMQSLYQDPHWFDSRWMEAEMDLSFLWPPK